MTRLRCPQCRQVVLDVAPSAGAAGTRFRTRCHNRHCKDKPFVEWEVTPQGTIVKRRIFDRRPAAAA